MIQNIPLIGSIILAINIIISFIGFNNVQFFDKYRFEINGIRKGEYYRLLTSIWNKGKYRIF